LNVFERKMTPQRLADVTTARVTAFATELALDNLEVATIARHLRRLKAILRWARKQKLLIEVPEFDIPKTPKGSKVMKGRAVTGEEFDRMIKVVPAIVENAAADSWRFYLLGLWTSGLRLTESLTLRWDDAPECLVVDFSHKRPMFRIPAEAEKGNKDRLLPMAPEFAELLQTVPQRDRWGRVFKLLDTDGTSFSRERWDVGDVISAIGEKAGVVVDERKKGDDIKKKFASAQDLRRSFGVRWALRVMPVVLKEIMRHELIDTTMKFYVGQNEEATADEVWAVYDKTRLCTQTQMWEASLTPIKHGITTCCAVGTLIAVRDRSHSQFWCKADKTPARRKSAKRTT
jgi:integrase